MSRSTSERLTRVEEQMKAQASKLGTFALAQRETRDEVRSFRTELFKLLNPLKEDVAKHGESIVWLKRLSWGLVALATGMVGKVVMAGIGQ